MSQEPRPEPAFLLWLQSTKIFPEHASTHGDNLAPRKVQLDRLVISGKNSRNTEIQASQWPNQVEDLAESLTFPFQDKIASEDKQRIR